MKSNLKIHPQAFQNGQIHNWYKIVFGYSDHLVTHLLNEFELGENDHVLDPFCGTGTTLVESMKLGLDSTGIDSNPSSFFAAKVKTNWNVTKARTLELLDQIKRDYSIRASNPETANEDRTFIYLVESGMVDRGWISMRPLVKAIALKAAILGLATNQTYKNFFFLLFLSDLVENVSNVKFGPTLYCAKPKTDHDVIGSFENKVLGITPDLEYLKQFKPGKANVLPGDSRDCDNVFAASPNLKYSAVITSPPYPTEHDYTRNSRLELAFMEKVTGRESLQKIKKQLLRSNTKGIYSTDNDGALVLANEQIKRIIKQIEPKAEKKNHGFARLYTTVVLEYFGGMTRHLMSLKPHLKSGAKLAYILGDQSSYLNVYVPTADILKGIAVEVGYNHLETRHWRSRWSSSSSKEIDENILLFQN